MARSTTDAVHCIRAHAVTAGSTDVFCGDDIVTDAGSKLLMKRCLAGTHFNIKQPDLPRQARSSAIYAFAG
ncbi:MAG: hypothetical protein WBL23_15265 [Salinisphaera sp.]|uniref:hypothetical protein n=1 Tax=Salinisphaera sp. TaxID=1914330 RepID=UPI003C7E4ADB